MPLKTLEGFIACPMTNNPWIIHVRCKQWMSQKIGGWVGEVVHTHHSSMDSMGVQMCFRSKLPFLSPMVGIVINPIIGSYIPTIRIPTKGGMSIPNIGSLDPGHKWRWTFFQRFFWLMSAGFPCFCCLNTPRASQIQVDNGTDERCGGTSETGRNVKRCNEFSGWSPNLVISWQTLRRCTLDLLTPPHKRYKWRFRFRLLGILMSSWW